MSRTTENHKHIRRRLEPLRIAVTTVSTTTSRVNGPRVCLSVVEAHGVQYRGGTIFDGGMDWSYGGKRPYLANRFVEECVRLSQLRHPNLATFYGIAIDRPSLTLVTDLPATTLDECLCRYRTIPEFIKTSILLDAARGLLYLHKQNPAIAHTGVSTRSIYLSSSMRAMVGDVGVAGALGRSAASDVTPAVNGKMPPKIFVNILETGTKCTDTKVDIPAFGNVIAHTVQQQQWLHPPGFTAVSPNLQAMPVRHPLYSLAYQCLQGKLDAHKQASRPDMDYVVQCLQHAARNNPLPFHNTLELFQALVAVEQNTKELHNHPITSQCKCNVAVQQLPLQDTDVPVPRNKIGNSPDQFITPPPTTCDTGSSNTLSTNASPTKRISELNSSPHHVNSPLNGSEDHCSFRSKSTGQVRPPPPKPPQRSSSFRRKSSDQTTKTQDSLRRTNSLRVKSSVTDQVTTQDTLQRAGSFRMKSSDKVMAQPQNPLQRPGAVRRIESDQVTTPTQNSVQNSISDCGKTNTQSHPRANSFGKKLPPPLEPTSPHMSPVIKTAGVFSSGSPKQNSLLLPSKFTPITHKEDVKQSSQTQKSLQHTTVPIKQPTPTHADLSEFERLLARQRMKVESDELNKTAEPQSPYTNGEVVYHSGGRRAATDMDLPKKKAPKPPRRTSSFKSSQKPTKYEGDCNGAPEVTFRQHFNITQLPSEFGRQDDQPSTSPSTGQTRPAIH